MNLRRILMRAAAICLMLLPVGGFAFESTKKQSSTDFADLHRYLVKVSADESTSAETCLACHGPFAALQERTEGHVAASGVPVNPHVTFDMSTPADPHQPGAEPIECTECHQPHPLPITEPVEPANIDMCIACHHTGTFRTCTDCH